MKCKGKWLITQHNEDCLYRRGRKNNFYCFISAVENDCEYNNCKIRVKR